MAASRIFEGDVLVGVVLAQCTEDIASDMSELIKHRCLTRFYVPLLSTRLNPVKTAI
jgi:hypothetical protein